MCNNNEEQDMNKLLLKESRKLRNKMKKELKRTEKVKEREKKTLALKFGPKDSRVTIISRELANSIVNTNKTSKHSNLEIRDDDFPILGQPAKSKTSTTKTEHDMECTIEIEKNNEKVSSSKRNKSSHIEVDIMDIILKPKKLPIIKDKNVTVKQYTGNILDSSQPERKRGKHRELPKKKALSKLKASVLKEGTSIDNMQTEYYGIHSPQFEIYCDNCITDELNKTATNLLTEIVHFQEKLFKRDPVKGVSKRRYIVGFHEVKKYLKVDKLELIIISPNIKILMQNGTLDSTINDITKLAIANDTPYVFALSRRIIGRLTLKHIPVSCIGILDYSGAEESFKNIMQLIQITRELYKNSQPSLDNAKDDIKEELVEKFIQALK